MAMRLQTLLQAAGHGLSAKDADPEIVLLTHDSRAVRPGALFFACPGLETDGRQYIEQAIASGATAVLYDNSDGFSMQDQAVPCIGVAELSAKVGEMAACFYGYPSNDLDVYAVTGTNGKSSCVHYLAHALQSLGQPCWLIGTLGAGFLDNLQDLGCTTPDSIRMQQSLAEARQRGAKAVALEASSHALVQHRMVGVTVDAAILTQISHDHLDYHGSMEAYAAAKSQLFAMAKRAVVFNWDDDYGAKWAAGDYAVPLWRYGLSSMADARAVSAQQLHLDMQGAEWQMHWHKQQAQVHTSLLGACHVENALAVATALLAMGYAFADVVASLDQLQSVAGRMQCVSLASGAMAVVDYAHTPDALAKTLQSLRTLMQTGTLWCVFGCGGNRDRAKRPLMTQAALSYADRVVLTSDNPRHETIQAIFDDMLQGCMEDEPIMLEPDRADAIAMVLTEAQAGDVVLIAGKGHESYQIVGDKCYEFSDVAYVGSWVCN